MDNHVQFMKKTLSVLAALSLAGCGGKSTGELPVAEGFETDRYLGKWYEIARFDHSFERGLTDVTAEYSMRSDGRIKVQNRGFNPGRNKWNDAVGVAKYAGTNTQAALKVSFFGPFWGAYRVIDLDKAAYRHALVASDTYDYLWILYRDPAMPEELYQSITNKAGTLGYDLKRLIKVDQSKNMALPAAK